MNETDREFMRRAIEASRNCPSEAGKPTPLVGAVVVKDAKLLAAAWRGEMDPGDHAEFIALEKKLGSDVLAGATVYTTLEPCTTRNHPKVPCANRLVERKVARVVIGMLDPNPSVCGKGMRLLRDHNVEVEMFPADLAAEVEDLNRNFTRLIQEQVAQRQVDSDFVGRYKFRDIDEWYKAINYIYADRNFYRDPLSIFAHLVEVIGGLSQLASGKKKPGGKPESFLPKALAWWFALCGKLGVVSVAELLWLKFPGVCAYCQREEHDATICSKKKKDNPIPLWKELRSAHLPSAAGRECLGAYTSLTIRSNLRLRSQGLPKN